MNKPALTVHQHDSLNNPYLLDQVRDIVTHQRYGTEYQPIVSARSGEITGYEALARFYADDGQILSPQLVFLAMHQEPALLRKAECELKQLQMDYAPSRYDLFLNLDPHALTSVNGQAPALLERLFQLPNVVVELIENTDIHDARAAMDLHRLLSSHGVRTALDDIGAPHALLSLDLISAVDFLKFDRSWFERLETPEGKLIFHAMLDYAAQAGRETILEGIENKAMLSTARSFGLNRVQGFLYRPLFRSISP